MDCQKCDLCHRSKVPSSDAFFKRQIVKKVLQTNLQKLVLSILPFKILPFYHQIYIMNKHAHIVHKKIKEVFKNTKTGLDI